MNHCLPSHIIRVVQRDQVPARNPECRENHFFLSHCCWYFCFHDYVFLLGLIRQSHPAARLGACDWTCVPHVLLRMPHLLWAVHTCKPGKYNGDVTMGRYNSDHEKCVHRAAVWPVCPCRWCQSLLHKCRKLDFWAQQHAEGFGVRFRRWVVVRHSLPFGDPWLPYKCGPVPGVIGKNLPWQQATLATPQSPQAVLHLLIAVAACDDDDCSNVPRQQEYHSDRRLLPAAKEAR
mmetsp:Transcript_23866/g.55668  ORF Transcript_23866/g.55668 Transcript_23866/m.55668 type:complete len:233 (+) Transcript_23866:1539-2237(+)